MKWDHVAQLYDEEAFMLESATEYIANALTSGNAAIVIATASHLDGLAAQLSSRNIDLAAARARTQYFSMDAEKALEYFMLNDEVPDRGHFFQSVGKVAEIASRAHPQVCAFGEMVALLCQKGHTRAAIDLERLWNELTWLLSCSLLCAYPMRGFDASGDSDLLTCVREMHSKLIPAESDHEGRIMLNHLASVNLPPTISTQQN